MSVNFGVAILAAGKGTRLKLPIAKAMAPVLGLKMVDFVVMALEDFAQVNTLASHYGIVVGHHKDSLVSHVSLQHKKLFKEKKISFCEQKELLGTADALKSYFAQTEGAWGFEYTIITCADTPLINADIFSKLYEVLKGNKDLEGVAATFSTKKPYGYGRIKREGSGFSIVEEKDATLEEKEIQEVNAGIYILKTSYIKKHLGNIDSKNNSGEFYLTDLFQSNVAVKAIEFNDASIFLGVNTQAQLSMAQKTLRHQKIESLQEKGVYFDDSSNCYLDWEVSVGEGTRIASNVYLYGPTQIGSHCEIEPGVIVKDCIIENDVKLLGHSYLEKAKVGCDSSIGPFARLRPDTHVEQSCKVGNFVEIKKARLKKGAKVSHLSYVGDAEIGEETNIGCGFITCNYDGKSKFKTIIGKNSFIGSDCQMVAPVTLGDNSFVAAGSTITNDVPEGAFAIARSKQTTKENMAKKFLK